jgi:hypothetical protein
LYRNHQTTGIGIIPVSDLLCDIPFSLSDRSAYPSHHQLMGNFSPLPSRILTLKKEQKKKT